MAASMYVKAMDNVSSKCCHIIENGLESLGQLDKPIGQLALMVEVMHHGANGGPAAGVALHATQHKTPTCLIIFFNGNHEGASKYAQLITEHPEDTHTVVAVQLGLPGRLESERKLQRLAQKSFVSVFTMVGGAVKTVVQQEPLSTPGGGVELWLSDLVKERESLPGEFVRPLDVRYGFFFFFVQRRHNPFKRSSNPFSYSRADHHQPNITIPYAAIVTTAIKAYHFCSYDDIDRANSTTPSSSITSGSSKRPSSTFPSGLMSNRGKQSLSTLAGRGVANGLFRHHHAGNKQQQHLSTFTQQQQQQQPPSIHIGEDAVKDDRPVVAPESHQRALGTAALPGGRIPLLVTSPARAMIAPWMRLLARLPRKW